MVVVSIHVVLQSWSNDLDFTISSRDVGAQIFSGRGLTLKVTCFENYPLPIPIDRRIGSDARTLKKEVPLKWVEKNPQI